MMRGFKLSVPLTYTQDPATGQPDLKGDGTLSWRMADPFAVTLDMEGLGRQWVLSVELLRTALSTPGVSIGIGDVQVLHTSGRVTLTFPPAHYPSVGMPSVLVQRLLVDAEHVASTQVVRQYVDQALDASITEMLRKGPK